MIQLEIVNYDNLSDLGFQITQYVNKNIEEIIRVLLDILETDSEFGLEEFFPRDFLMREPQKCRNEVYELYEILRSKCIRDFIKPEYEYLLYRVLGWWEDCSDDETELLINPIDENLKHKLEAEENGDKILKTISDFKEYYYICFQDFDFLPEQLNNLVLIFLKEPKLLEMLFQYDNLDDFINLMDCDLRQRYLEVRCEEKSREVLSISDRIVKELLAVFKRFEKRIVHFQKRNEVEITADIQDAIAGILNAKLGISISREFTMGRAIKNLGETDLYFFSESNGQIRDYAVLENKYIEKFTEQYCQLMGYLNCNFECGITLSINKNMPLKIAIEEIEKKLKEIEGDFKPINIKKFEVEKIPMIISEHLVPETGKMMKVFHLIFNLYDNEREEVALRARKKADKGCKV